MPLVLAVLGSAAAQHASHAVGMPAPADAPGLRAGRAIEIADLIGLQDIGGRDAGLVLTPDRSAVAFQLRSMDAAANRHRIEWFSLPLPGDAPLRIADGGELITVIDDAGRNNGSVAAPVAKWSPDGQWLAYLRKRDGDVQLWRARRDGAAEVQLTRHDGDIDRFVWSDDSARIMFTAKAAHSALRRSEESAYEDGFLWDETFWLRYSRIPAQPRKGDGTVWVLDIENGHVRVAGAKEVQAFEENDAPRLTKRPRARNVVLSEDGRAASLEALNPELQGRRAPLTVVVLRPDAVQPPAVCSAAECTGQIASIRWHPEGDRVYFIRREGHAEGQRALYEWRIGASHVRRVHVTDDWIADCEILQEQALCLHEAPTQPRRIVRISLRDGSITPIFDPNSEFQAIAFTQVETLKWRDRYGNDTLGHLVYPVGYRSDKRYPLVIVQYHSRGFLRAGVGGEYPIHILAAHGFFVLSWERPVFWEAQARLAAEEASKYAYADKREHLSKQSALEFILDHLVSGGLIDPARVGITGVSDGAETIDIGLIHSKRFAAVATSTVADDPIVYYFLSRRDRIALRAGSGLPAPDESAHARAWWSYISPALNISRIDAPILMNLSDAEATTAAQLVAALQDSDKPFEAYIYPREFHIKQQPRHLLRCMERSVDWFDFWLRNAEDPNPHKAEQYRRWRGLRELQRAAK